MNILKGATLAAVAVGLSLVLAVPALADEGFNGVYRYIPDLGDSVNVTISSNCEIAFIAS